MSKFSKHMRIVFDTQQGVVTIEDRKINNLRYADDTLTVAYSIEELEYIVN